MTKQINNHSYWQANFCAVSLSVLIFLVMEWLFVTTKPSFLSLAPIVEKLFVLIVSIAFVSALLLLLSLPFILIATLTKPNTALGSYLISVIPAFVFSSLVLLLVDNFTYTLFKVGIVNSTDLRKIAYLIGFVFLLGYFIHKIQKWVQQTIQIPSHKKYSGYIFIFLTVILSSVIFFPFVINTTSFGLDSTKRQANENQPNIILITADGVDASHLNIYGYNRETTPFLSSLKDKLIISNNHFTNSGNTTGSITSILTSKYPTTTRVLYPPDILRGSDTIEHLPAILRDLGYYVAQFSVQHFVDALDLNFQNGFMEANGVSIGSKGLAYRLSTKFPSNSKLFLQEVEGRLVERLRHIFFIQEMENTYTQITQTQTNYQDVEKIDQAINLINTHEEPVFVHIHWMGTHGSLFYPDSVTFSAGIDRTTQQPWDKDLYDDAIIDLDIGIARLNNALDESNELENTIVLITSDHGQGFSTKKRLPLILLVPDIQSASILTENTQNLDIAPTILDYLNVTKPSWMRGQSILDKNYSAHLILSTATKRSEADKEEGWVLDPNYIEPPFYQFDYITIIDCDKAYSLDLENLTWTREVVQDYSSSCLETNYLPTVEIRQAVIDRFKQDKFEFEIETIPAIPADY